MQSPKDIVNAQNAGKNNYEEQKLAPHFLVLSYQGLQNPHGSLYPAFMTSSWVPKIN